MRVSLLALAALLGFLVFDEAWVLADAAPPFQEKCSDQEIGKLCSDNIFSPGIHICRKTTCYPSERRGTIQPGVPCTVCVYDEEANRPRDEELRRVYAIEKAKNEAEYVEFMHQRELHKKWKRRGTVGGLSLGAALLLIWLLRRRKR